MSNDKESEILREISLSLLLKNPLRFWQFICFIAEI